MCQHLTLMRPCVVKAEWLYIQITIILLFLLKLWLSGLANTNIGRPVKFQINNGLFFCVSVCPKYCSSPYLATLFIGLLGNVLELLKMCIYRKFPVILFLEILSNSYHKKGLDRI